jgi:hypothetical protein
MSVCNTAFVTVETTSICTCEELSFDVLDGQTFGPFAFFSCRGAETVAASVGGEWAMNGGRETIECPSILIGRKQFSMTSLQISEKVYPGF